MSTPTTRYDRETFLRDFERRPFTVEHSLEGHPALRLERLAELAGALPDGDMEWNGSDLDVVHDPARTQATGLGPVETIERIHEVGSWIVLKRIEQDPEFRELLEGVIAGFAGELDDLGRSPFRPRGFIFVSSSRAVTPLHLDPEVNFLLQVKGSKSITVFDRTDRALVSAPELERFAAGGHRNVHFDVESAAEGQEFVLGPGHGVHVPLHAPHFVRNGDEVSVSLSVTFQTERSDEERAVLILNHKLRRLGLHPRSHGESPRADRAKHALVRSLRSARGVLRRGGRQER